jgi:hypothetical protein
MAGFSAIQRPFVSSRIPCDSPVSNTDGGKTDYLVDEY